MALLCLFSLFLGLVYSTPCDIEPFQVLIQDVQVVANISGAIMKGIPATVGNPPQQIALLPWAELNNTWIYDQQGLCDKTVIFSDTICLVRRGNFFLENESTSWTDSLDIIAAGGAGSETQDTNAEKGIKKLVSSSLGGTDNFDLAESGNLSKFPIGIPRLAWDTGYSTMHALGLGTNSTYLNALIASGRIGSRVWAIFWGRMWSTMNPIDGSIVFGGYDRKKVIGNNHTQALDFSSTGCWTGMMVTVTDIKVNFRDGTDQTLFQPNEALRCCIVPQRQLLFEAPSELHDRFEDVTNTANKGVSFGLHWSAYQYEKGTEFDGDITIQLSSGLEIRIPNDQYVVPHVFVDYNGSRLIDDNMRDVLMSSIGEQVATLGRYFLTSAYLMVNQDANSFTIWQANPSSSSDLVAVLDEKTAASCANTTAVVQPPVSSTSSLPVPTDSSMTPSPSKSSAGTIAGAVIGAVAAVGALVAALFFYLRRRQAAKAQKVGHGSTAGDIKPSNDAQAVELQASRGFLPEMEGSSNILYEMAAARNAPPPSLR